MATFADTLLRAHGDMAAVHRRVVRVGAAAAWFAVLAFLVVGFVAGNESLVLQAISPVLIGGFMTAQVLLGREDASIGLTAAALVVVAFYSLIGDRDTIVPAGVALVIICALAMVFVERHMAVVVAAIGVALFVVPHVWSMLGSGESWSLGIAMSLSFVTTAVIFVSIRSAMTQLDVRFQMLFEQSPTAVMEEDWSEAIAHVRSEYAGKPERIRAFLLAYPSVVRGAVSKARILRVNRAAIDLFEADGPEDLLGLRRPEKVTDQSLEGFAEALAALYEERTNFEHDVLTETLKQRQIWLQIRAADTSPDRPASRLIVGLADITHIKERTEAMARLVQAKDEFIARVSHELRTPLTAVVGLTSEVASMEGISPEEQQELMHLVAGQAAEMSHIVEDLLVAARAEIGTVAIDRAIVDLEAELARAVDGLGARLDDVPLSVPEIWADPGRVRQILRNLLTNAERYGGIRRWVAAGQVGDKVWLEVRDDGEGVPEGMEEAIFEPYISAHEGMTGSVGLGLSVARQLAQMMGGSLEYRREAGETVFRLELPAATKTRRTLASTIG